MFYSYAFFLHFFSQDLRRYKAEEKLSNLSRHVNQNNSIASSSDLLMSKSFARQSTSTVVVHCMKLMTLLDNSRNT